MHAAKVSIFIREIVTMEAYILPYALLPAELPIVG